MKKNVCIYIIALLTITSNTFGQNVTLSIDSVTKLLCKKWEVDYAMMGGTKIGRMPGATEINYEFNKDKTFVLTGKELKDSKKGTWSYDSNKKLIKLTMNGKSGAPIVSLKDGEFIMLADTKNATPDDPMEIRIVYKIKEK